MKHRKQIVHPHYHKGAQVQNQNSESDPVFTAHPAYGINSSDVTDIKNLSGVNTGDQDLSDYVKGPASAVDHQTAVFSGVTGKLIRADRYFKRIINTVEFSGTALADVTGLNFDMIADRLYWFRAYLPMGSGNSTEGAGVSVDGPADPDYLIYHMTVTAGTGGGTSLATRAASAYNYSWSSSSFGINLCGMGLVEGYIIPSSDGTLQIRARCETANYKVWVYSGAFIEWRDLG